MLRKIVFLSSFLFGFSAITGTAQALNAPVSSDNLITNASQNTIILAKAETNETKSEKAKPKTQKKKQDKATKAKAKTSSKNTKDKATKEKKASTKKKTAKSDSDKQSAKAAKTDKKQTKTAKPKAAETKSQSKKNAANTNPISRQEAKNYKQSISNKSCSCASQTYCVGPRDGHYCYTSGGNKRYLSRK